jgi:hypothetical protein
MRSASAIRTRAIRPQRDLSSTTKEAHDDLKSIIGAPSLASNFETVLLPEPIPPVSPIVSIKKLRLRKSGPCLPPGLDIVEPVQEACGKAISGGHIRRSPGLPLVSGAVLQATSVLWGRAALKRFAVIR